MTHEQALKMRSAIQTLFSLSSDERYEVSIKNRYEGSDTDECEVHIFIREANLSGLINCALLSKAIEEISCSFLATDSEYDISTSGESNIVPSFKIW